MTLPEAIHAARLRCAEAEQSGDTAQEAIELRRLSELVRRHADEQRIRAAFPGADPSGWKDSHEGPTPTTHGVPWVREDEEPTNPDASVAADLIRDTEPILSGERDQRASEAP